MQYKKIIHLQSFNRQVFECLFFNKRTKKLKDQNLFTYVIIHLHIHKDDKNKPN